MAGNVAGKVQLSVVSPSFVRACHLKLNVTSKLSIIVRMAVFRAHTIIIANHTFISSAKKPRLHA